MKRTGVLFLTTILLIGCASRPDWVTNPPQDESLIFGLGSAQMTNEPLAWLAAENRARQSLAYQIQTLVEGMQTDYGRAEGKSGQDFFTNVNRQLSTVALRGAMIYKRGTGKNNLYYVLTSYKRADADTVISGLIQTESAQNIAFNAQAALDAMDRQLARIEKPPMVSDD